MIQSQMKVFGGVKLRAHLQQMKSWAGKAQSVHVGFLDGSERSSGGQTNIPTLAVMHEFGSGKIPSRPFMRNTVATFLKERDSKRGIRFMQFRASVAVHMQLVGKNLASMMKREIKNFKDPPNAPATLKRKRGSNPLIDTGKMLDAVDWQYMGTVAGVAKAKK